MKEINIKKRTIGELNKGLKQKDFSAVELLDAYMQEIDQTESKINAFVNLTKDIAQQAASSIDKRIAKGEEISLLAGIPLALKDNFNLLGTKTTASSKILDNYISPYNATVTQRLLDAGAVIVGKANMDAFAHGSSTETSDYGVTKNPYDLERIPGGSSGGSAAAVAANMVPYAIGSETAGSVRGPAAWCGLYGFAPTYGRFSRYGVIAMGSSLDRPGILTNSLEDIALVSDVLSGVDVKDATSIPEPKSNYYNSLKDDVMGLKIGIPRQFLDDRIDAYSRELVALKLKEYEKLGAKLIEIDLLDPKYAMAVYTLICRSEVSSNLARIDGIRYGHVSSQKAETILDQISLNRGEGFGNEAKQRSMTGAYALSAGYYDAYYKKAQRVRTLIINDFKRAFKEVDIIAGPTMPGPAPKIGVTKNNPLFGEMADLLTEPSALSGLPCISIPIGNNSEGLPIGMQLFGPQFKEQLILDTAFTFEKRIGS
jgi:aspartyl-tRNA(Asn)/glutamyl-tRNA(Gln) amidotransferase subunit A